MKSPTFFPNLSCYDDCSNYSLFEQIGVTVPFFILCVYVVCAYTFAAKHMRRGFVSFQVNEISADARLCPLCRNRPKSGSPACVAENDSWNTVTSKLPALFFFCCVLGANPGAHTFWSSGMLRQKLLL